MKIIAKVALSTFVLLTFVAKLPGQERFKTLRGQRIRVSAPDFIIGPVVGTIVEFTTDSIWLSVKDQAEPSQIPLDSIEKLEVSKGRKSRVPLGFRLLAGGTLGFLYGKAGHPGLPHVGEDVPPELEYLLPFTIGGMVLGTVIGGNVRSERWVELPLKDVRTASEHLGVY